MKTEKITLRLTSDEKQMILDESKLLNISCGEYIRRKLNDNYITNSNIGRTNSNIPENVCNILTEIQNLRNIYPNLDLDELERRTVKLWQ